MEKQKTWKCSACGAEIPDLPHAGPEAPAVPWRAPALSGRSCRARSATRGQAPAAM